MIKKNVPLIPSLNKKIILCSQSPRRAEILKLSGLSFEIRKFPFNENISESPAESIPEELAVEKSYQADFLNENEILITADTMVLLESRILGKPNSREEALNMLKMLSGKTHKVLTGVAFRNRKMLKSFTSTTFVEFDEMNLSTREEYVDRFQPFDKAGSYGIQEGIGITHVKSINGCFYNVMGLPMRDLFGALNNPEFN